MKCLSQKAVKLHMHTHTHIPSHSNYVKLHSKPIINSPVCQFRTVVEAVGGDDDVMKKAASGTLNECLLTFCTVNAFVCEVHSDSQDVSSYNVLFQCKPVHSSFMGIHRLQTRVHCLSQGEFRRVLKTAEQKPKTQ